MRRKDESFYIEYSFVSQKNECVAVRNLESGGSMECREKMDILEVFYLLDNYTQEKRSWRKE